MNVLFPFYRFVRKTPVSINRLLFYFLNAVIPPIKKNILDPLDYLKSIYPDNGKSSLCENNVKDNPKYDVQVIVPVFNVEKYLEECLNSIINQKTKYRFCVVAVNDGSTDGSLSILKNMIIFRILK